MVGGFEVSRQVARRLRTAAELPTEHPVVLDEVQVLLGSLPDPDTMCAEQRAGTMAQLARLGNQIDACLTELAETADREGDSRVLHAGTSGMLVAVATRANPQTGSATVARGRALRGLPLVARSFRAGAISAGHVAVITGVCARIKGFAGIEAEVVTIAEQVEPGELRRLLGLLADQSRPEGKDDQHRELHDKRSLSLSETLDGMFRIDGWLDPVAGGQLRDALAELMTRTGRDDPRSIKQRRADALAELMTRTGRDDPRSIKQRRADALADLVAAAAANRHPTGISGLSVLVDLEDLSDGDGAQTPDGSALGARLFDLITCTAVVSVILGTRATGLFVPLALARTRRGASPAQWAALIARDRGCIRCGRAPQYCQAHHIHHWRHGGMTDLSNLVLLCQRCHHDLHFGQYTITMNHGIPTITPTQPSRAPPNAA